MPSKRLEHQLGQSVWCPDFLGDNARGTIVPLFDGRLGPVVGANFSEYDNPTVNRLIDQALAEPDPARRAAMWGELDQRIMRDAPLVPLIWKSSRTCGPPGSTVGGTTAGCPGLTSPPRGWTLRAPDRDAREGAGTGCDSGGLRAACLGLGLGARWRRLPPGRTGPRPGRRARGHAPGAERGTAGGGLDTAARVRGPAAARLRQDPVRLRPLGRPDDDTGPGRRQRAAQVSADRRTYTFRLRAGVRYGPPLNREVTAQDFITAIERLYDRESPSAGQQFANLIAGANAFGAGKAKRISGLAALDPRTLKITLVQPAGDLLWILTLSFFAPVPEEHAAGYGVGGRYDGHVVGAGPYKLATYIPGETVVLDRNPNWDPATDPLRNAWVDRIQVKLGLTTPAIQQAIDRGEADLSLTSHVPQTQVAALQADPERSRRLSVEPTGNRCTWSSGPTRAPGRSPTSASAGRSVTPSTRRPTATPSPAGSPRPASWPPPSWPRPRSAISPTTCTRRLRDGAIRRGRRRCWPRPATPRG